MPTPVVSHDSAAGFSFPAVPLKKVAAAFDGLELLLATTGSLARQAGDARTSETQPSTRKARRSGRGETGARDATRLTYAAVVIAGNAPRKITPS